MMSCKNKMRPKPATSTARGVLRHTMALSPRSGASRAQPSAARRSSRLRSLLRCGARYCMRRGGPRSARRAGVLSEEPFSRTETNRLGACALVIGKVWQRQQQLVQERHERPLRIEQVQREEYRVMAVREYRVMAVREKGRVAGTVGLREGAERAASGMVRCASGARAAVCIVAVISFAFILFPLV